MAPPSPVIRKSKGETGSPSSPILIEDDADAGSESAGDDSDSWTEMDGDKPKPEIHGPYECCDVYSDDFDKESGGIEQEADLALDASGDEEDTDRAEAVEVDEENESLYRILFSCLKDENDADEELCADTTNMETKRSSSNPHTKRENESRESDLATAAKRRETGKPSLSAEERRYHVLLNSVTESVNACPSEGTVNPLVKEESEIGPEDDDDGDDKPEPSEADKWLCKMRYSSLTSDESDDPADDV